MPQYDAYEDPLPVESALAPNAKQMPPTSPLSKVLINKPLTTCHDEGINKISDTDTPEVDQNSPPPSPYHFHRRHSHLSRQQGPMIESFSFPEPSTSPMRLTSAEKDQLEQFNKSQQQDDAIRMDLQSSQQEAKEIAKEHREQEWKAKDAEIEFDEKKHMLKGGWMHRSRGSCELLQDRKLSWDARG